MDHIFKIESRDLDNKYLIENSITIKLPDEKYEEFKEIAIEVDETIEEMLNFIANKNLLDKMEDEDFKQLVIDAYYEDTFNFE